MSATAEAAAGGATLRALLRSAEARLRASGIEAPQLDARLLLAAALEMAPDALRFAADRALSANEAARIEALLARRIAREPVSRILGRREFWSLEFRITPDVLDPRADSETLIEAALALFPNRAAALRVLDLGTGSGAIAIAIAHARPDARVTATDIDPAALALAQANARRHGAALEALQGSWWQPLAGRRFELIVSNPPYIAAGDLHLPALRHEPQHALVSGADGLDALRRIAAEAAAHLAPGGRLLVEHGAEQGAAVRALVAAGGLQDLGTRADLGERPRCSGGALAGE